MKKLKITPSISKKKKDKTSIVQTFYVNQIFETDSNNHYTERALLYQNILEYSKIIEKEVGEAVEEVVIEGKKIVKKRRMVRMDPDPPNFRIRELARWLMKRNLQFLKFYRGKRNRTTMSARIANNDQLIKKCIYDLESSHLLIKTALVESSKNKMETPIYSLTEHGVIISYLIKYKNAQANDKSKIQAIIIELVKRHLSNYNSYMADFLSLVYTKSVQKGLGNSMINLFSIIVHTNKYNVHTLNEMLNISLFKYTHDNQARDYFVDIFVEVIDELEEKMKQIIMFHFKADIENQIHTSQPPRDWEKIWIQNINDCTKFVLYGTCSNCYQKYPVLVDFYVFQRNANPKMDCDKCKGKDTLQVSDIIR